MTARRLELGARARADLADIWTYTGEQWGREQAERYGDELNDAMAGLAEGSRIGHPTPVEGYHGLRVGAHMIYYRLGPTLVRVVRILHMRQDAARHLTR